MASNCKAIRAEIEEQVGADAGPSRAAAAHLAACAGCADFLGEREALRRLVGGLERVEAPGDFEFRLRARMAAAQGTERRGLFFPRLAPGLASTALAAVFVASVAAYYFRRPAPTAVQSASQQTPAEVQTAAEQPSPTTVAKTETVAEAVSAENKRKQAAPPVVDERAAVNRPSKNERRRVSRAAAIEPRGEVAKAQSTGELEFGLSTSQVIKGTNVKLEVPGEPLSVVLRDEHGTPRRLAMKPVSFGAQNPVGKRKGPSRTQVADKEGVW